MRWRRGWSARAAGGRQRQVATHHLASDAIDPALVVDGGNQQGNSYPLPVEPEFPALARAFGTFSRGDRTGTTAASAPALARLTFQ